MNNVTQIMPEECCGCTACFASCPTKAITMQPDAVEGFLYPQVDDDKCIDCGKCIRVCKDVKPYAEPQHIFACWSKDDTLRARSSSGGIFSLLAVQTLRQGGVVCAVGYSDDCKECLHKIVTKEDELDDLRRAKFVQSKKYDIYQRVRGRLGGGKKYIVLRNSLRSGRLKAVSW